MKSAMRSAVIQTMQQTSESRKEHDRSNNGRADDGTSRAEDGTSHASLPHHAMLLAESTSGRARGAALGSRGVAGVLPLLTKALSREPYFLVSKINPF